MDKLKELPPIIEYSTIGWRIMIATIIPIIVAIGTILGLLRGIF